MSQKKEHIVSVGAGRMGRGIAHVFAYSGHPVTLIDFKARSENEADRLLEDAQKEIAANLDFLCSLEVMASEQIPAILERITYCKMEEANSALETADVIFEGVTEVLDIKKDVFTRLNQSVREEAIIASTTSTIFVNTLAGFVHHPQRFLNAHWLNPAYLIPLVEVSPGEQTDSRIVDRMMQLLKAVGKVPVQCKASPGYIISRIQCVAMNEAVRMVVEGVATPEDIDQAICMGFGVRYSNMGLVEFIDWGGVDILYYASKYLQQTLESDRYASPPVIEKMMQEGKKGLREGQGFYDFRNKDVNAYQRETLGRIVALLQAKGLMPAPFSHSKEPSRD